MARIAGVDLPRNKRIEVALTYIFGIGLPTAQRILSTTGVNPDRRVHELNDDEVNRLRRNMPLQADPTVQYAVAKGRQALTRADLMADHPFNTYRRVGLPPGPIASPGLSAIRAALEPAPVEYLYFVALDDRRHHFSSTIEEHNAAVVRYRKWRRSGGRAATGRPS